MILFKIIRNQQGFVSRNWGLSIGINYHYTSTPKTFNTRVIIVFQSVTSGAGAWAVRTSVTSRARIATTAPDVARRPLPDCRFSAAPVGYPPGKLRSLSEAEAEAATAPAPYAKPTTATTAHPNAKPTRLLAVRARRDSGCWVLLYDSRRPRGNPRP